MGQAGSHSGRTSVRPATTTLKFTPLGASPRTNSRSPWGGTRRDRTGASLSLFLPATSYQLPATSYQLPATSYQLPATGHRLPATDNSRHLPEDPMLHRSILIR